MNQTQDSEDLIERYLLGELSPAERAALETEYLADQARYDQFCRVENDLLDRYARGALSTDDHERVERQYLTNPWRRRHVEFAKTFTRVIDEHPPARSAARQTTEVSWRARFFSLPRSSRLALGMIPAIVVLLIVFAGAWFAIETSRLRARLADARREAEDQQRRAQAQASRITEFEAQYERLTEENERLQAQLQAAKKAEPSHSQAATAAVFLTISVEAFRSSGAHGPQTLTVPRGVTEARLRLYLPENAFPAYRVSLLAEDGSEVFSKSGLRPRAGKAGDFVIASLPTSRFANGDNVVALSGIGPAGEAEPLGKSLIKVIRR